LPQKYLPGDALPTPLFFTLDHDEIVPPRQSNQTAQTLEKLIKIFSFECFELPAFLHCLPPPTSSPLATSHTSPTNSVSHFGDPMHFSFVSHMFDEIYHEDFQVEEDGQTHGKETLRLCHAHLSDLGCIAKLLEFKYIGCNKVEARFVVLSEDVEVLVHSEMTVKDNQFIKMAPFDKM
jgi:hypothetical protein